MVPNLPDDDTQSIHSASDPREIARQNLQLLSEAVARPEHIGPYRILETLGEGGMGIVYLAEQTKPIHRRVALKIIKLGMDTKQVIARFETEREALALMNHPNVAKVFDAGVSEQGRPYFVMEYVAGIPITEYCDKHRLSTEERLRLFMDVCNAIQHAHQKGIIHRDIKPSNVLVSVDPSNPPPSPLSKGGGMFAPPLDKGGLGGVAVKVIDFGVAKATQHRLTERTLFTEQGQLIGTPGYMSPEQAEMTALDIDTRTDIYSLGVLLYELLVGAMPFDTKTLLQAGLAEIQRIIREVDPPKPSTKLSMMQSEPRASATGPVASPLVGGAPPRSSIDDIAHRRHTEPKTLIRQIRGDLDWIVMRAMEKDRTRRYDTANGLAMELQRYLNNEPVLAGPPTAVYRFRKFARRNKAPLGVAALIFVVLLGAAVFSTRQYLTADAARRGEAEAREDAEKDRDAAETARDEAEQVTQFLTDTLAAADPSKQGKDVTVREVLDRASEKIGEKFAGKPLIEAQLKYTVGLTYHALGLDDRAASHLAGATVIYRRVLGESDPRTLMAINAMSVIIAERGYYRSTEAIYRSTLETQRSTLGEEHPHTLVSMHNLATNLHELGRYPEAEELLRKTLEIRRRVLGEEHPDTFGSMTALANSLNNQGHYAEADELLRKTLEIQRRVLGEEHPNTLLSMNGLAVNHKDQGHYAEAEELYRKTLEIQRRVLGEEHPRTLGSMNNLANSLGEQGRYAEAEELHRKTLEIQRRVLGEEHPFTLGSMNRLACVFDAQERYFETEQLAAEALAIWEKRGETTTATRWLTTSTRGGALTGLCRLAEAEPLLVGAYDAIKDRGDVSPADKRRALERIIRLYDSWDAAESGKGYADKAAQWRAKHDEMSKSQNVETSKNENAETPN